MVHRSLSAAWRGEGWWSGDNSGETLQPIPVKTGFLRRNVSGAACLEASRDEACRKLRTFCRY